MATRRTKPEPEAPAAEAYDMGFAADDLTLPRLRVVGKDARLVELGVAKGGDIAIGADAEDEESTVYEAPGGVKFYVIAWRSNYACGFNGPKGSWEDGDPEMPADAKKQYHYTLLCPDFDTILPVVHTANGSAAKVWRNVNTKLAKHSMAGAPYEVAFELRSKMNTANIGGQQKSWPGPVISLAEADPAEVEIAKAMHDSIVGPGRRQLDAGSGSDAPTF